MYMNICSKSLTKQSLRYNTVKVSFYKSISEFHKLVGGVVVCGNTGVVHFVEPHHHGVSNSGDLFHHDKQNFSEEKPSTISLLVNRERKSDYIRENLGQGNGNVSLYSQQIENFEQITKYCAEIGYKHWFSQKFPPLQLLLCTKNVHRNMLSLQVSLADMARNKKKGIHRRDYRAV
jgi:hypothetical protein